MDGVVDHHDRAQAARAETRDDLDRKQAVVRGRLALAQAGGVIQRLQDVAGLADMARRAAADLEHILTDQTGSQEGHGNAAQNEG